MSDEIEEHIAAVEAFYGPLINGSSSKLLGGSRLWMQFQQALVAYRKHDGVKFSAIFERINEMAVGQVILADVSLVEAQFAYEPHIVGDGSKIDFVVTKANNEILYIEVKTIHPETRDSEVNWQKYQDKRKNHTENTYFIVYKNWLGSEIYGESFSSRSKFMEYTIEFESLIRN